MRLDRSKVATGRSSATAFPKQSDSSFNRAASGRVAKASG
jgi:hypothetical protein